MNKRINKILFPVMLWMIPIATLAWAYSWSINALANKIYSDMSKPFLANGVIVNHSPKKLTTEPSHIEYTVLKVNSKPVKK